MYFCCRGKNKSSCNVKYKCPLNSDICRTLCRAYKILSSTYDLSSRAHDIIFKKIYLRVLNIPVFPSKYKQIQKSNNKNQTNKNPKTTKKKNNLQNNNDNDNEQTTVAPKQNSEFFIFFWGGGAYSANVALLYSKSY